MTQTPHATPEKKALLEAFDTVLKTPSLAPTFRL